MSAPWVMVEGFLTEAMTTVNTNNGTGYKGTIRIPETRKMLDGTYGSSFKNFVIWPGSRAYNMATRLSNAGKPLGGGSHLKLVLVETEAEYMSEGNKRISTNYEVLDLAFVSLSANKAEPAEAVVEEPAQAVSVSSYVL